MNEHDWNRLDDIENDIARMLDPNGNLLVDFAGKKKGLIKLLAKVHAWNAEKEPEINYQPSKTNIIRQVEDLQKRVRTIEVNLWPMAEHPPEEEQKPDPIDPRIRIGSLEKMLSEFHGRLRKVEDEINFSPDEIQKSPEEITILPVVNWKVFDKVKGFLYTHASFEMLTDFADQFWNVRKLIGALQDDYAKLNNKYISAHDQTKRWKAFALSQKTKAESLKDKLDEIAGKEKRVAEILEMFVKACRTEFYPATILVERSAFEKMKDLLEEIKERENGEGR